MTPNFDNYNLHWIDSRKERMKREEEDGGKGEEGSDKEGRKMGGG